MAASDDFLGKRFAKYDLRLSDLEDELREFKEALARQASKSSLFDREKVQPSSNSRYIPLGRRRAAAERATLEPVEHKDQVRANNARAMES